MPAGKLTRRGFMARAGGAAAATALSAGAAQAHDLPVRKFYTNLSLGSLGFHASFDRSVELASKYGFEAVAPDPKLFARLSNDDLQRLLARLRSRNLKFGAAGFPVDFRGTNSAFNASIATLTAYADTLVRAGVDRTSTYIMPASNTLTYLQNFRQHACRLRQCGEILAAHGLRLGLEYVATRTVWRSESSRSSTRCLK